MLREGIAAAIGTPETVFTPPQLESVYDLPFEALRAPNGRTLITPRLPASC